jgi:hypothetical protein
VVLSVTYLGAIEVIDPPAIMGILGAIVGSAGVLTGISNGARRNGRG